MEEYDLSIKRHDTFPSLTIKIFDKKTRKLFDLAGAKATFTMLNSQGEKKIDSKAAIVEKEGRVSYSWVAEDTDTSGRFRGEFEITLSNGKKFSQPQSGFLKIFIEADANNE